MQRESCDGRSMEFRSYLGVGWSSLVPPLWAARRHWPKFSSKAKSQVVPSAVWWVFFVVLGLELSVIFILFCCLSISPAPWFFSEALMVYGRLFRFFTS